MATEQDLIGRLEKSPNGLFAMELADYCDCDTAQVFELLKSAIADKRVKHDRKVGKNSRFQDWFQSPYVAKPASTVTAPQYGRHPEKKTDFTAPKDEPAMSKVELALEFLRVNGPSPTAHIRKAMGLNANQYPSQYLVSAISAGKLHLDVDTYHLGPMIKKPNGDGNRDARDIGSDPGGVAIVKPGDPLAAAVQAIQTPIPVRHVVADNPAAANFGGITVSNTKDSTADMDCFIDGKKVSTITNINHTAEQPGSLGAVEQKLYTSNVGNGSVRAGNLLASDFSHPSIEWDPAITDSLKQFQSMVKDIAELLPKTAQEIMPDGYVPKFSCSLWSDDGSLTLVRDGVEVTTLSANELMIIEVYIGMFRTGIRSKYHPCEGEEAPRGE